MRLVSWYSTALRETDPKGSHRLSWSVALLKDSDLHPVRTVYLVLVVLSVDRPSFRNHIKKR